MTHLRPHAALLPALLALACAPKGDGGGTTPPDPDDGVVCTMDAKICPDGTGVGRSGPNCEFDPCPGEEGGEASTLEPEDGE